MIRKPWLLLALASKAASGDVCGAARHTAAGGHSCGGRVTWLVDHSELSAAAAGLRVAREFPVECWRCLEMATCLKADGLDGLDSEALRQLQMMNCGKVTKASLQFKAS